MTTLKLLKYKISLEPLFKPLSLLVIALGIYELLFTDGSRFIALLATYRISYMVTAETGPFDVVIKLRSWVYHRYGHLSWQFRGMVCVLCVSFWVAWLTAIPLPGIYPLNALAIACGCMMLHRSLYQ